MKSLLSLTIFHNRILDYLVALLIFMCGLAVILLLKRIFLRRLNRWVQGTTTRFADFLLTAINNKLLPLLYFGVFYLGAKTLTLHPFLNRGLNYLGMILLTFFGIRFLLLVVSFAIDNYWLTKEKDTAKRNAVSMVIIIGKALIWGLAVIVLLDNFGIKISGLLTGLGIGGIAVALAAQTVLGDLFGYFTIFFDRPFEVGDYISVEDYRGTVEHIGVKTTRIRSITGEQLIFANTDLIGSRVRNYKRMERRRNNLTLQVSYQTSLERLREIPVIIKSVIEEEEGTLFDRAHFASFGDYGLIFEAVYYILSSDYQKYMDIQQSVNLRIKEEFEERGIEFAYPTQRVFVDQTQKTG